ncbi:MAG: NAD(P)-dependent oxidoreductase, partial [Chloroflexi bacterium]|nr:NAD(P)-dependent oxidoreductase [Chloroflexota bacterium]
MIIVDTALEKREKEGNPVRVGIIGAGYMGRGMVLQIETAITGMRTAAVYNRTISEAARAYRQAGVESIQTVKTTAQLE